jgi:D-sedoheptulose 7-phosphate isomerase
MKPNFKNSLENNIKDLIFTLDQLKKYELLLNKTAKLIFNKVKKGGKIFICGNGGSAADAQHLAAEFLVRLRPHINRKPIPAISLALDTSTLTACGNDYNFNSIFSRNLEALAEKKDVLIAISTSGKSKNIIDVLKYSKKKKIYSFCFLGKDGGNAKKICDEFILVPSNNVARIQESHILLGHTLFEKIEDLTLLK